MSSWNVHHTVSSQSAPKSCGSMRTGFVSFDDLTVYHGSTLVLHLQSRTSRLQQPKKWFVILPQTWPLSHWDSNYVESNEACRGKQQVIHE